MSKDNKTTILEGQIKVTGKGIGYFPIEDGDDYEIQPENINTALNRDEVKVELLPSERYGRKQAKVTDIIKRSKTEFVGTLDDGFVIPDDTRFYRDIFVPKDKVGDAKDGDKVQVKLTEWSDPRKSPTGEIVRAIGRAGEHNVEMQAIVYDKGFDIDFPPEVEVEAERIKEEYLKDLPNVLAEIKSEITNPGDRRDLRDRTTFTIDPDDAKDFDDALSIKTLDDGNYEVGIHIADVSHFVEENSIIDEEAQKRGTSIYLVDRTIPMLPEVLSNDLCSLNPNEPKFAFSAVFIMNSKGQISERWFGRGLIESDKRFTYEEAQETLDKGVGLYYDELKTLDNLAKELRKVKFQNGAIDFETEEVKFVLDDKGVPIKVYKKERKDTHKLVEDFMLLANREVAKYMSTENEKNGKAAFVYRIHDEPDKEKIMNLATFVKALGFELKNNDGETTAVDIANMVKSVTGTPAEALIKTAAIRSMSKAIYSTSNIGHFGLAFKYYTHFTSPIRRYPDLLVHRLLYRFLTHGQIQPNELAKYSTLAAEASERELDAAEAERSSIKYKQVEYMQEHVGEEFDATVSGVSEWGIYVEEVNTKAEGMVRLRDMKDDFYELNEKQYAIVGKNTGNKYTLGDKVRVKLINADSERKVLDFSFV